MVVNIVVAVVVRVIKSSSSSSSDYDKYMEKNKYICIIKIIIKKERVILLIYPGASSFEPFSK